MEFRMRDSWGYVTEDADNKPFKERAKVPFGNCGLGLEAPGLDTVIPIAAGLLRPEARTLDQLSLISRGYNAVTKLVHASCNRSYEPKTFNGSHGALGGSPVGFQDRYWDGLRPEATRLIYNEIIKADRLAMNEVWGWMSECFRNEGLRGHPVAPSVVTKDWLYR